MKRILSLLAASIALLAAGLACVTGSSAEPTTDAPQKSPQSTGQIIVPATND
jgi:hypothetical protein